MAAPACTLHKNSRAPSTQATRAPQTWRLWERTPSQSWRTTENTIPGSLRSKELRDSAACARKKGWRGLRVEGIFLHSFHGSIRENIPALSCILLAPFHREWEGLFSIPCREKVGEGSLALSNSLEDFPRFFSKRHWAATMLEMGRTFLRAL